MEALIAGEQQEVEPGKFGSRCPMCRKKVKRLKTQRDSKSDFTVLEIKGMTKSQFVAQKLKASSSKG